MSWVEDFPRFLIWLWFYFGGSLVRVEGVKGILVR